MSNEKKELTIALVGCGIGGWLHCNGYQKVSQVPIRYKYVCDSVLEKAEKFRDDYGFEQAIDDYDAVLADPEVDVIDITTPPFLHIPMIEKALKAGKHVFCEKPLTGYFGEPGDPENVGEVPKSKMYESVIKKMDGLRKVVDESDKLFLYAENFVHCTPIQKAAEIIRAKKSKILFFRAEQSVNASSSPTARWWKYQGGGILVRSVCHPLTGILWMKREECRARGEEFGVVSVVADTGRTMDCLTEHEHRHLQAHPVDVEDFSNVIVTFKDGTKATIMACDMVLGGTHDFVEAYANDSVYKCNFNPNDLLDSYFADEDGLEDIHFNERLPHKLGWAKVQVSDEIIRGFTGELQNLTETVYYGKEPKTDFDLAYTVVQVLYAAYVSAEEGRRVFL